MGDRFVASTQFGDLEGGASFDGHDGPPLFELAKCSKMKSGYWPVGFELHQLDPDENGKIPFTLVAVSCEEAGKGPEEIYQYADRVDEVKVYRFPGEIDPKKLPVLFKRVDIKVIHKAFVGQNVVAYYPTSEE